MMKARIVNFRGGKRTQRTNQMVLIVESARQKSLLPSFWAKKCSGRHRAVKKLSAPLREFMEIMELLLYDSIKAFPDSQSAPKWR